MTATRKRNQFGSVIVHRRQCDMPARILKLRAGCLGKIVHTSLGHELDAARITTELSPRAGDSIRSDDGRQTPRSASERLARHAERVDGRDISFAASLAPGDYSPKGIHAAMSAVAQLPARRAAGADAHRRMGAGGKQITHAPAGAKAHALASTRAGDVAGDDGLTNDLNGANAAVTKVGEVALQLESIPGIRPQNERENRERGGQGKDDAGMRPMGESGVRL